MTITRTATLGIGLLLASALTGCLPEAEEHVTLVIVGGTFLARAGIDPIDDAVILIEENMIAAAGPQSHIPFPKGVETLDARGLWIVPGTFLEGELELFPPSSGPGESGWPADLLIFSGDPRGDAGMNNMEEMLRYIIRSGKTTSLPTQQTEQP